MRPDRLKFQSLEQRLVYCRAMQGDGWPMTPKPQPPRRVSARDFQRQGEGGTWLVAANFLVWVSFVLAVVHRGQVMMFL